MRTTLLALLIIGSGTSKVLAQAIDTTTAGTSEAQLPYTYVEQMPLFGEHAEDALRYVASRIKYPGQAIMERAQGTVLVGFTVRADGRLDNIRVLRSAHPALDKEALRVVQEMPSWHPGRQTGRAVPVAFSLPVTFRIAGPARKGAPNGTFTEAPEVVFKSAQYQGTAEELNARLYFPTYPTEAQAAKAEGRVVVLFDIDTTGQVTNVKAMQPISAEMQRKLHQRPVLHPLHPSLPTAAEATVKTLASWQPSTLDKKPLLSHNVAIVNYQLQSAADTVYQLVDKMPEYFGGEEALVRFIASKTKYPSAAWKEKAEGEVLLYFVINKLGEVENPEVLQSVHPALDAEALRVVRSLPVFIPAQHHGRTVRASYLLPMTFSRN
ncbi:TonB family protein [Hymenobacter tenuis]